MVIKFGRCTVYLLNDRCEKHVVNAFRDPFISLNESGITD
jgi:hypothetical protein